MIKVERNDNTNNVSMSWDNGLARMSISVTESGSMNISCYACGVSSLFGLPDTPLEELICMLLDAKRLVEAKSIIDKLRGDTKDPDDIPF